MSASNSSSPMSALSPHALVPAAPSTMSKPLLAPMPGSLHTPSIFTNKEWVIPPRPKPGRKPAADTPPTKRKAQNRAAQRAFRERRAARVGELEDQMKQIEEEDEKEQDELRNRINQLEADVENYNHLLVSWRERFQNQEMDLNRERQLRQDVESQLHSFVNTKMRSTDAVPLPPRITPSHPQDTGPREEDQIPLGCGKCNPDTHCECIEALDLGCGRCTTDSRCECIEQALDMSNLAPPSNPSHKRPNSPLSPPDSNKRSRYSSSLNEDQTPEEVTEIDFTNSFSVPRRPPLLQSSTSSSSLPVHQQQQTAVPDLCGFCHDGTPCICAQMASAEASLTTKPSQPHSVTTAATVATDPLQSPCVNGPGTCAQCLASPKSTLFCRTLAATARFSIEPPATTTKPKTLTCADAFQTISRHEAFHHASKELATWMPRLTTVPRDHVNLNPNSTLVENGDTNMNGNRDDASQALNSFQEGGWWGETMERRGRTAFDIEAASVMGVLRFFDRRFGRDGQEEGGN